MNIKELTTLMIKSDDRNRLPRGERLYKEGLVTKINSMVDAHFQSLDIFGVVKAQSQYESYNTNISIDLDNKDLVYTECQCADYKEYAGFNSTYICKHIGASFYRFIELLRIKLEEEENKKNQKLEKFRRPQIDYSNNLLDDLDKLSGIKEKLALEIFLARRSYLRGEEFYEASFKIGNNKTYVIKNIAEFLRAREMGNTLSYGKLFTYDPDIHYFSKDDEKIINFAEEYLAISEAAINSYSYKNSNPTLVKNKILIIPRQGLRRFLEASTNKVIHFSNEDDEETKANIIKGELPLNISLDEVGDTIVLTPEGELPEVLNLSGDVLLYNKNFYLCNKKQAEVYKVFYNAFIEEKNIKFKEDKKQQVFSKVLPSLENVTNKVEIKESLKKSIVRDELFIDILFDRDKKRTWAKVNLKYGNESFDLIKGPNTDQYIIRDLKKERMLEDILADYLFYRDKDKFIFTGDEEELYSFLSSDLVELKKIGEIYYSDRFKERKIYGTGAVKATISEGAGTYLDFQFQIGDIPDDEINMIMKAFKEKRKFYKLKNQSFIDLQDNDIEKFFNLLDTLAADNRLNNNSFKVAKNRSILIDQFIDESEANFIKGQDVVKNIAKKVRNVEEMDFELPDELNATLREYQVKGFKWLKTLSYYQFGGVLADEMGLGKTLQIITFLLSEKNKKSLIVTPTSLIYNWKSEFEKFAPTMNVEILHGDKESRVNLMNNIDNCDVIITTYATLRNDFELYKDKEFDFCIIDEGQNIKNPLSLSSEVVKEVNAKVKFALTGTPIENSLVELWSLFDFVMPGYLYSRNMFIERFTGKEEGIANLKKMIKPFILRRLKKDVIAELPEKIEKKFLVELTEEQKKIYSAYVKEIKTKLDSKEAMKDKITIFSYLTRLRQLCLDPSVVIDDYNGGSGKIEVLLEVISDAIDQGRKVLVFSQFTSILGNIKDIFRLKNIKYSYLDGSTKAIDRIDLVNEFNNNSDINVFLISLKAGGAGLNLTSAHMVIHFDPWWNPAIEDQATDRAHRIGQENVVEVIKLISKGTIEEKIVKLQEDKKELISKVISDDYNNGTFLSGLSEEEIIGLFN